MKILLIEDEIQLAKEITQFLIGNNIICEHAINKDSALEKINQYEYDCILLDLMLPDGNGLDILKELKLLNKNEGVIIISAKEHISTKIEGLQLGADDYLTKPFHLPELHARIQALVRRKSFNGNNVLKFNEISIDLFKKNVIVNGLEIKITKKEYDLMVYLIGNSNRVLSKETIAENLSGDQADLLVNHDFVYAHIKNLKKKLLEAGAKDYIKTVYGIGYRWQS